MGEKRQEDKFEDLRGKLERAQRQLAGLKQKGKYLHMQYEDAQAREKNTNDLIRELLERQRELNVMLNRANIMLNRTQETMALTSIEFNEMAKALPEPKKAEWSTRVARINEMFKKTGVQDAELISLPASNAPTTDSLDSEELRKESQEAFSKRESIWGRKDRQEPERVHAELVDDNEELVAVAASPAHQAELVQDEGNGSRQEDQSGEDMLLFPPQRKSWWRRAAG